MKNNILKLACLIILIGSIAFSSCKTVPTPTPELGQEEYDASIIQFVLLNADGSQTTDTTSIYFDRTGTPTPNAADLTSNKKYKLYIILLNHGNNVDHEIVDEGTIHQFFFIASQSGIFDYAYNDVDSNNRGIGLVGTASIGGPGNTELKVVLRHGIDKSKPDAQGWNNVNYENAGGEDDLNILFQITAQ